MTWQLLQPKRKVFRGFLIFKGSNSSFRASPSASTSPFRNPSLHGRLTTCLLDFDVFLLDLVMFVEKRTPPGARKHKDVIFFKFMNIWR